MKKEKKYFKREYIPVYISTFTLILLIVALVALFLYDKEDFDVDKPEQEYIKNEMVVDTSGSTCSADEKKLIHEETDNVEIKYEPMKAVIGTGLEFGEEEEVEGYIFKVTFHNMNENMFATITNDNENTQKKIELLKFADAKNGVLEYLTESSTKVVTYTVRIYTHNKNCENEMFRKFTFVTPVYNRYHEIDMCQAYPEFELCQEFIDVDRPSLSEFQKALYEWGEKEDIIITNLYEKLYGTTSFKTTTQFDPKADNELPTPLSDEERKKNEALAEAKRNKKDENVSNNTVYIIIAIGLGIIIIVGIIAMVIKKKRNRL